MLISGRGCRNATSAWLLIHPRKTFPANRRMLSLFLSYLGGWSVLVAQSALIPVVCADDRSATCARFSAVRGEEGAEVAGGKPKLWKTMTVALMSIRKSRTREDAQTGIHYDFRRQVGGRAYNQCFALFAPSSNHENGD
jgi:hypothetical protein